MCEAQRLARRVVDVERSSARAAEVLEAEHGARATQLETALEEVRGRKVARGWGFRVGGWGLGV